MAVMHYQFEAIHPFIDGNGRTGRILNLLYLVERGLLDIPVLYLSGHIIQNKRHYYDLLLDVTTKGDWQGLVLFIIEAVETTARWSTRKIMEIRQLLEDTAVRMRADTPKIYSRDFAELIFVNPYCRIADVVEAGIARRQTASTYLKALSEAGDFSVHAPRIETMQIPTDKIREVIGSGGKVIREIVETSGAKVDINDDGTIKIASANADSIKKAYEMIHSIVAEPEEGKIYTGKVVKLVDFGAFVNFFGKRDGLVHVSQIENRRLNHPSDVLKEGQDVWVKLLGFDDRGKVRLSMKVVDQTTGQEISAPSTEDA